MLGRIFQSFTHIISGALYGIEYLQGEKKGYRFWAVECERTSPAFRSDVTASSSAREHIGYKTLIKAGSYKKHWGIPNLNVRFVDHKGQSTIVVGGIASKYILKMRNHGGGPKGGLNI
jgi:hypothetical protein